MGTDAPRTRRPRRLRALFITLGIVLSLVLVAGGLGVWTVTRSFPTLSGNLKLSGLDADVTVYRDDAGIPQIVAETANDLFVAEGYVHAQDRFWEMDFRRHVTSGRLSELFGESQVGTDTFIRTLGWRAVAEQEVKLLDPTSLGYYEAYARGVNEYLDTHRGADLSLEYVTLALQNPGYSPEPWTAADSIAWLKAMAWDLRSNLDDEIDRALLAPTVSEDNIALLHPEYPYATHPTIVSGAASASTPDSPTDASAETDSADFDDDANAEAASGTSVGQSTVTALSAPLAELRAALANVPELLGPAGGEIGSNSWVVAGVHTDTGKPILANDPHLGAVMPSVWYQIGLRCKTVSADCPFDVAGYSFSGLPGVVIGHNSKIAWGFTNLGPDVADLYLERVTGANYEYDGASKPLAVRGEKIKVAGGSDVKIEIRSTEHGPIVSGLTDTFGSIAENYPDVDGVPAPPEPATTDTTAESDTDAPQPRFELALQWTALTPGRTASAIFALNTANNWSDFKNAASRFDVPSQNLIYADVDGNIGYQAPGLIPIRKSGDGTLPVPGWTSDYGWTGYIPFDELPQSYNPPSGYIVTANNAAVDASYPAMLTKDWDLGYRAAQIESRLRAVIDSGALLTAADMSSIQADNYSAAAATLVPVLQKLKVSKSTAAAVALFTNWDYTLDADSAAAAYFSIVWRNLLADVFATLPEGTALTGGDRSFSVVATLLERPDDPWWTSEKLGTVGRDNTLAKVLEKASDEGVKLMGKNTARWSWGSIHTLELTNASFGESGIAPIEWLFNRGPYEVGGGSSVVNAVGWDATVGYTVDWVPSMRQVVSLADFDTSTWVNLTGASGHAFHPNYTDQTPLWQHHQTRQWLFGLDAVKKAATNTLTLSPAS